VLGDRGGCLSELLAELLEHVGHVVRVAHDGPAALRILDLFVPDLALLDIGLPSMDGYELARRLRERHELQNVSLVAVSGYGQEADRERSRQADPNGLIAFIEELTEDVKADARTG
jgi:CheY-like chemotaxis protein